MKNELKYWWLVLLKGILLVILSFFVFGHPVSALIGLALYIGITLLVTGFLLIAISLSNTKSDEQWGWKLTEGILDVIFAYVMLSNPAITASVFPFVVGFWMIFYGIMLFTGSFAIKKAGDNSWWVSLLGGILTVVFGYIIMTDIFAGAFAITIWIGMGYLLLGLMNLYLSFRMRKLNKAIR